MDASSSSGKSSISFKHPGRFLGDLDASTTGRVVAAAADIALVLDKGVIKDIALGAQDLVKEGYEDSWRGRHWSETVTEESRAKIADLLKMTADGEPRWRQVNHASSTGIDLPVKYIALSTGRKDRVVALGRDMRAESTLQRRLIEAHQGLERDYARVRAAEMRYRLLFSTISEPVLIAGGERRLVEEANPAAVELVGEGILVGQAVESLFEPRSRRAVEGAIAAALSGGAGTADGAILTRGALATVHVSAFRDDREPRLIIRLSADDAATRRDVRERLGVLKTLECLPDGLVVADSDLDIVAANAAFQELVGLAQNDNRTPGRASDYIGRSPTDFNVLMSNLKRHGFVRNYATVVRDRLGTEEEVEVSAVSASADATPLFAFSVRNVSRRLKSAPRIGEQLPSSADQLTDLVGRVPLKEIVRDSTDLIERLCIEAALEITGDNRASAAEMLGLSRQGLYSKLKRFGLDL